jgi:hypothetical protein
MKTVNIATDFSRHPGGRVPKDGPFNGETFRKRLLEPALRGNTEKLVVILDGIRGSGSSFLEEAFGGLVRAGFAKEDLLKRIEFRGGSVSVRAEIMEYIESAEAHA